jgi:hypothetical protein
MYNKMPLKIIDKRFGLNRSKNVLFGADIPSLSFADETRRLFLSLSQYNIDSEDLLSAI